MLVRCVCVCRLQGVTKQEHTPSAAGGFGLGDVCVPSTVSGTCKRIERNKAKQQQIRFPKRNDPYVGNKGFDTQVGKENNTRKSSSSK